MSVEPDVPHEPFNGLHLFGWLLDLWPRLKGRLHRWCHGTEPACPDCAEWRAKADVRAMECQSLETAADGLASQLRACRVLAQSEKARADEAERRFGEVGKPEPLSELLEAREAERPLPPIMRSATARRAAKERGVPVCRAAVIEGPGCTRLDGKPAITTAEIIARVREART